MLMLFRSPRTTLPCMTVTCGAAAVRVPRVGGSWAGQGGGGGCTPRP